MKVFWNDGGHGVEAANSAPVSREEALRLWSDEVRGVEGNFLGLTDDAGRTIQFYFAESIPDHVDDAGYLRIVDVDIPVPERGGSFVKRVCVADVADLIDQAFTIGVEHQHVGMEFILW